MEFYDQSGCPKKKGELGGRIFLKILSILDKQILANMKKNEVSSRTFFSHRAAKPEPIIFMDSLICPQNESGNLLFAFSIMRPSVRNCVLTQTNLHFEYHVHKVCVG